jgi:histidinol phosphatase-like PHP family hydrolase
MLIDHDMHVHTLLSACSSDIKNIPENILKRAAEVGLKTIGFADHMWDSSIRGASSWYVPQDMNHIMQIKDMIPEDTYGVKVLIGCETEYCGDGKVGISQEAAEKLDFLLVPISHVHMKGFVLPLWVDNYKDIARIMVHRFKEVLELDLITATTVGIPHPFLPVGYVEHIDEVISYISDDEFIDCFGRATEAGVGIEIQSGTFAGNYEKKFDGFHDDSFMRVFTLAKKAGCKFYFASDSHAVVSIGDVLKVERYIREIGIGKEDIFKFD